MTLLIKLVKLLSSFPVAIAHQSPSGHHIRIGSLAKVRETVDFPGMLEVLIALVEVNLGLLLLK